MWRLRELPKCGPGVAKESGSDWVESSGLLGIERRMNLERWVVKTGTQKAVLGLMESIEFF